LNALYDAGREGFLDGSYSWTNNTIQAMLVRSTAGAGAGGNTVYTAALSTDKFLSTIPNNNYCRVATSAAFTSKTATAGVANAAPITFTAVAAGDPFQLLIIYYATGSDATSRLIAFIDSATGLPMTPNGGDVTVNWDTGSNKILKL
jgi:hypothetical protein